MSIITRFAPAKALGFLVFASVATTACGDDNKATSIPVSGLALANATAACKQAVACTLPDSDGSIYAVMARATPEACATTLEKSLPTDVEAWVANGLVTYDATKAADCLDALGTTCIADNETPEACESILTGLVAPGGACEDDDVCAGDARCDQDDVDGDCAGTCVTLKALGEDCAAWNDCSSQAGAAECDFVSKKCVASKPTNKETAAAGEPCGWMGTNEGTRQVTCADGFVCGGNGETSVCTPILTKGADCTATGVCEVGTLCIRGETASTCEAIVVVNAAGTACNETDQTKVAAVCNRFKRLKCGDDGKCAASDGSAGSACEGFVLSCNAGFFCDDETSKCTALKAAAADCSDDEECASGYCSSEETCAALTCE